MPAETAVEVAPGAVTVIVVVAGSPPRFAMGAGVATARAKRAQRV